MISIISLLALIMYSHVVFSQRYKLEDVTSHAGGSAVGATSHSKRLSYDAKQEWDIGQGDCLQVREDDGTIIYNIQLAGRTWRGPVRARFKDPTVEHDLDTEGYPKKGRSVWRATPRGGRGCSDGDYANQRMLIGHEQRPSEGRGRSRATDFSGFKKPKKKGMLKRLRRSKEPKPLTVKVVHRWQFEPDESTGKQTLYHHDLSRALKEEIHSFKSGECIAIQAKGEDFEFEVYCLKDGMWAEEHGMSTEYTHDEVCSRLAYWDQQDPDHLALWVKKIGITGKKEEIIKERVWPKETGAAADAYVEYEDEMDGFASKYDGLLAQFEYDVEVEEAREKKARTHLAKEKYDILRAKNRKNKY